MRSRTLKTVSGLLPLAVAFLLSDKTIHGYAVMMVGGLFLWIPYWLVWWLTDGFRSVRYADQVPTARMSDQDDGEGIYWNFSEGHFQSHPGPSTYRL
jgi:hypothetical protein